MNLAMIIIRKTVYSQQDHNKIFMIFNSAIRTLKTKQFLIISQFLCLMVPNISVRKKNWHSPANLTSTFFLLTIKNVFFHLFFSVFTKTKDYCKNSLQILKKIEWGNSKIKQKLISLVLSNSNFLKKYRFQSLRLQVTYQDFNFQ